MKLSTKIFIVLFVITGILGIFMSRFLFSAISVENGKLYYSMDFLAYLTLGNMAVNMILGNILYFKFLKSRKFNTMLFFATAPLMLSFAGLTFVFSNINNYNNKTFKILKTALNIQTDNNNNYYWIGIVAIVELLFLFFTVIISTRPIKKVEQATKRLSYGKIKDDINIGGNKQFEDIENSLNKINDNYKKKDKIIKQTNIEYKKIIPKDLLKFLGVKAVKNLEDGSEIKKMATVMYCNIHNLVLENVSLEQNFNELNSYLNVISPIITKSGGYIDKYFDDGLFSIFSSPTNAINCALNIFKTINLKNSKKSKYAFNVNVCLNTQEINFKIIVDDKKKQPMLVTDYISCMSKMNEINKNFGSNMIMSKNFLTELKVNYKLQYRYIGKFDITENKKLQEVFECLNVYKKPQQEKLKKYSKDFSEAINLFYNGKYEDAKQMFIKVYQKEKEDKVCYAYYNKCCENLGEKILK